METVAVGGFHDEVVDLGEGFGVFEDSFVVAAYVAGEAQPVFTQHDCRDQREIVVIIFTAVRDLIGSGRLYCHQRISQPKFYVR